jgi:ABC-type nitrate/sulfonate/bicarbonate transport system substrate-binding protein
MAHLLASPWGGTGGEANWGHAMVDARTVAQWDYATGNVLAASDAFLAAEPELVQRVVDAVAKATFDYVDSVKRDDAWAADGAFTAEAGARAARGRAARRRSGGPRRSAGRFARRRRRRGPPLRRASCRRLSSWTRSAG